MPHRIQHTLTVDDDHYVRRPSTLSLSVGLDVPDNLIVSRRPSSIPDVGASKDPGLGWRHIQLLLMCSAVFGLYTHRSCLSVAIVAMTKNNATLESDNDRSDQEVYDWSRQEQGTVLSAFLWGYALTQVPAGYLTSHFGAKRLMGIGLICSSICLVCIPFVASQFGWLGVAVLRVCGGAVQGILYPGTYTLLGKWAVPQERGRASAFTVTSHAAGIFLAIGFGGFISEHIGWPSVFYIFGALTVAVAIAWIIFCADSPDAHPWISSRERDFIVNAIGHDSKKLSNARIPWLGIFTCVPFLSLCICQVGYVWGQWKLLTALPRYINEMFDFSMSINGILSATPYLFNSIVGVFSGWLSDVLINNDCVSTGFARKMFNTIGFWGPAVLFLIVPFTPSDQKVSQVVELTLAVGLCGAAYSGLMVNYVELSPRYSGLIFAVSNSISSVASGVALPISDGFVDLWGEEQGWAASFYLTAIVLFVTNLIWILLGTSVKQRFNDVQKSGASKRNGIDNETFSSP